MNASVLRPRFFKLEKFEVHRCLILATVPVFAMRSLLVIFLCLSRYFLFVPAFQLRRSDLLHQNSNSRYFPLYFHPNKPSPCLRTAVSVIPTDNDSEKDEIIWLKPVLEDPKRSWCFSILMATCGAMLGPFLDA